MFVGHFAFTLDSKARLTIPAKFRDELSPALIVTRNPIEPCLLMLPWNKWEAIAAKLSERPMTHKATAVLRRMLFSTAEDLKPDGQGRILLSQQLRSYAHIEADVVINGMNDYLEIWNRSLFEQQLPNELPPEMREDVADLGI
ncbi:MAG: division/cell wall cluster transcriptional repressor MraZ [Caldilineaceae bacterium]